jgi:hypothetical protein
MSVRGPETILRSKGGGYKRYRKRGWPEEAPEIQCPLPPLHLWEEVISILIVAEAAPLQNIPNKRVSRKIFFANDLAAI